MSTETVFWIWKVKDVWMVSCKITKLDMHIKVQALRWKLPQNGQTPTFSHVTQGKSYEGGDGGDVMVVVLH
jgi:hypothetical protein